MDRREKERPLHGMGLRSNRAVESSSHQKSTFSSSHWLETKFHTTEWDTSINIHEKLLIPGNYFHLARSCPASLLLITPYTANIIYCLKPHSLAARGRSWYKTTYNYEAARCIPDNIDSPSNAETIHFVMRRITLYLTRPLQKDVSKFQPRYLMGMDGVVS